MQNRLTRLVFVAILAGFMLSIAITVSAQTHVTASVEASAGATIETSFNQPRPDVVLNGQKWKPATKILQITGAPTSKLSLTGRFDLGTMDDAPVSVDAITGRNYTNLYPQVRSYVGTLRQIEIGGSYQILPHVAAAVNYLRYTLKNDEELLHATTIDGAGWIQVYTDTSRYQGVGFGPTAEYHNDKVSFEGGLLWYPSVSRHWNSHENSLGQVFVNDIEVDGHTSALQLSGKVSYQLIKHLDVSFSYRYQRFATSWSGSDKAMGDGQVMYLKVLTPAIGFTAKF